jgi:acyl-coenzyme A synthetase/AMP-(fatty) acid ligase
MPGGLRCTTGNSKLQYNNLRQIMQYSHYTGGHFATETGQLPSNALMLSENRSDSSFLILHLDRNPENIAIILHSSGSTGTPKRLFLI